VTLSDYTAEFQDTVLPLKKPSTQGTFASHFRTFLAVLGDLELEELTTPVVQRFITDMAKKHKPGYVRAVWGTLINVLNRAERNGLLDRLPRVDLPKLNFSQDDTCCFSVDEMRRMIAVSPVPAFDALMAETGMRPGEALALTEHDISGVSVTVSKTRSERGEIGPPKTRAGFRTLSISPHLAYLLKSGFPFLKPNGSPWCHKYVAKHIRRVCVMAGVKEGTAYGYRRGNATMMTSVLEIHPKVYTYRFGHKPGELILGLYARPVPGFDRDCANKLAKLLYTPSERRAGARR
jgi:integrase